MTSASPLQISILPQGKKSKKSTSIGKKIKNTPNHQKPQQTQPLSPFWQILTQSNAQTPPTKTKKQKISLEQVRLESPQKTRKKPLSHPVSKMILTQNQLKLQKPHTSQKPNSPLFQDALKATSQPSRTLKDIKQMALKHDLNLSQIKLEHTPQIKSESQDHPLQARTKLSLSQSKKISKETLIKSPKTSKNVQKNQTPTLTSALKEKIKPHSQTTHNPSSQNQENQIHTTKESLNLAQTINPTSTLSEFLKDKTEVSIKDEEEKRQDNKEKLSDPVLNINKKETQLKIAQSRETLTHFSNRLKEEIANYKPPFTKLSMELNPKELGKLEITITKKGKELSISVNANQPQALQTFIQNQNDLRISLAQVGFNNIDLNFSQGEKQQGQRGEQQQKRNKNGFTDSNQDFPIASTMEIKMVQYA